MMICPQCRKMDLEIRAAKLSPCLFSTCWTCIEAQWARKFAHMWISEKHIRLDYWSVMCRKTPHCETYVFGGVLRGRFEEKCSTCGFEYDIMAP